MSVEEIFLNYAAKTLGELHGRIETCLGKLTAEQIWARQGENENAIGNLLLHLQGNVRQWILSGIGGEPDLRRRDGEYRWIYDKGVPRYAPNGDFVGYIGSAIDIADRKRVEELSNALAHMQRLAVIGEMSAAIAHEVRQPLSARGKCGKFRLGNVEPSRIETVAG